MQGIVRQIGGILIRSGARMLQGISSPRGRTLVPWAIVLFGSFVVAAFPFFLFRIALGMWLPDILPQVSSDALYYVKQMREVIEAVERVVGSGK